MKRHSLALAAGMLAGCTSIQGPCSYSFDIVADGAASETLSCSAGGNASVFTPSRPLLVVDRMERDAGPLLRPQRQK